jgi:hypothetical protein
MRMLKKIFVCGAALILLTTAGLADDVYKMAVGKPGNIATNICFKLEDMKQVIQEAKEAGTGKAVYTQKAKEGKCGLFNSTKLGDDMAVIDEILPIPPFKDTLIEGESLVIRMHVKDKPELSFFGLIGTEQIDNGKET